MLIGNSISFFISYFTIRNLKCRCAEKHTGETPFRLIYCCGRYIDLNFSTNSFTCKGLDRLIDIIYPNLVKIRDLSLQNFQAGKDTAIIKFEAIYLSLNNIYMNKVFYFENLTIHNSSISYFFFPFAMKCYSMYFKRMRIINSTINNSFITLQTRNKEVVEFDNIHVENSTLGGFLNFYGNGIQPYPIILKNMVFKMNRFGATIIYGYMAYIDISNYTSSDNLVSNDRTSDISVFGGDLTIRNSLFSNAKQISIEGYISASSFQNVTVIDTTFENGLGIFSSFINTANSCRLIISNCKFINSLSGSAAISSYLDNYISISNCIFENSNKNALKVMIMKSGDLIIVDTVFRNFSDSAIYVKDVFEIKIKRCSFILPTSQEKSAVGKEISYSSAGRGIQARITNLVVEDCIFANTRSEENGGAIYTEAAYNQENYLSTLSIKNSQFLNSSGAIGGAVYIQATNNKNKMKFSGFIDNCIFTSSTSVTAAGALGYSCNKQFIDCYLSINNSTFINNSVTSLTGGGGSIKYFSEKIASTNNMFQGNTASFAPDILGIPSEIVLKVGKNTWSSQCLSNSTNGSLWNCSNSQNIFSLNDQEFESIKIYIYDDNEQFLPQNGMSKATISYNKSTDLQITPLSIIEANGVIDFSGMIVNGSYGSKNNITVTVSIYEGKYIPSIILNFSVFIPPCTMGEQTTPDRKCIKCPYGKYLYDPGPTCWDCPKNLHCYGGSTVATTAGYWRYKNTSNFVITCPNIESCLPGNENNSVGICDTERGFTGIACSQCLPNYMKASNICMLCPNSDITNLLFIFLVGFGILAMNIYFIIDKIPQGTIIEVPQTIIQKHEPMHSIYIKILINHILLVTLIAQFNITWPKSIHSIFGILSQASAPSQAIYSVECFSKRLALDQDLFFIKLITAAAFPLVYSLIINIVWKVIHYFYPSIHETDRVIISIVVISMQFHVGISKTGFLGLSYMFIDQEELRVFSDLRTSVYDKKYLLLGLPFSLFIVFIWGFGLLAFIFYILFKQRRMIIQGDEATLKKYKFLISEYKNKFYFWDLLIQGRKFLLTLLSSFLIDISPVFQISLAVILLFIYLYLLFHVSPYKDPNLNKVERISCLVCLFQFILVRKFYLTKISSRLCLQCAKTKELL